MFSIKVPREVCSTFEREPREPSCRTKTRVECRTEPTQKCHNVVGRECRMMPRQKCDRQPQTEKCSQKCQPVYWCKVCQQV